VSDASSGTVGDGARTPRPPDLDRRTLTPFGYAVCVVVPVLLAAIGLVVLHFHYDKEQLVSGTRLAILTSGQETKVAGGTDQLLGKVTLGDDRCVTVVGTDGTPTTPVWPKDYEATVQRVGVADQVKVYDTFRNIAARSEQTIEVTGQYADAAQYAGQACAPASGEVFVVESKVKVVSQD
jgi:hypothetical protein